MSSRKVATHPVLKNQGIISESKCRFRLQSAWIFVHKIHS